MTDCCCLTYEDALNAAYLQFLEDKVANDIDLRQWSILLDTLHSVEFYALLDNDENRAEDGKILREEFVEKYHSDMWKNKWKGEFGNFDPIQGPCSVLEMMIGLAKRMEFVSGRPLKDNFWTLIHNLGLDVYRNFELLHAEYGYTRADIVLIVTKMMDREYTSYGRGSLFPLKKCRQNQKEVEIWYQMMNYLNENFTLFE